MEKKKFLLNYCMLKFAQKEQELLSLPDTKTALIGLTFAHQSLFRRFISGCTMQEICFADTNYPQSLLLLICLEACANGDNLLEVFDFKAQHCIGKHHKLFLDKELSEYLEKDIFPEVKSVNDVDFEVYRKLSQKELDAKNVMGYFFQKPNLRHFEASKMLMPEPCDETAMIFLALETLGNKIDLESIFAFGSKYNMYGDAYLQLFFQESKVLKEKDGKLRFDSFSRTAYDRLLKKIKNV